MFQRSSSNLLDIKIASPDTIVPGDTTVAALCIDDIRKTQTNGLFITIEGLDGAGKTTQAQILYQYFIDLGIKCILTKEPSPLTFKRYEDTADKRSIAQIVRGIVYSKVGVDPIVELTLIYAARLEHVQELVLPALERGEVVICDRFIESSITYLGFREGARKANSIVNSLHKALIPKNLMPDITVLLDIGENESLKRTTMRRMSQETVSLGTKNQSQQVMFDKYDMVPKEQLLSMREILLSLAKKHHQRIALVNGRKDIDTVQRSIVSAIHEKLNTIDLPNSLSALCRQS